MAGNPLATNGAVVLDAKTALAQYLNSGYLIFAPCVIVSETLYALRNQLMNGLLTPSDHGQAV
jgi:hypothetical protein